MAWKCALLKLAVMVVVAAVAWRWYEQSQRLPPVWDGFYKPEFKPVADVFQQLVEDGTLRGGSFAAYHQGERLVELWGGYADPDSKRPWREDTVTQVFSVTKGLTAVAVAKLVEQGHLDYKKEVRHYWPEFAQNGKASVTLEMLLSHQAGLALMGGQSVSLEDYRKDWKKVEQIMAAAAPEHPPGRAVRYHAMTFGMYAEALIRRVDPKHRNLSQFFQDEIAKPFGIDFYIGLPRELVWRVARIRPVKTWEFLPLLLESEHRGFVLEMLNPDSTFHKSLKVLRGYDLYAQSFNDPTLMDVGIGSAMGFGSAGSLAKLFDYLANDGRIDSKQLLPKNIVDLFSKSLTESLPSTNAGFQLQISLGFWISTYKGLRFGHDGYGGQQTFADPQNKLGIAYVTNFHDAKMATAPDHYMELERVFYECFEKQKAKAKKSE